MTALEAPERALRPPAWRREDGCRQALLLLPPRVQAGGFRPDAPPPSAWLLGSVGPRRIGPPGLPPAVPRCDGGPADENGHLRPGRRRTPQGRRPRPVGSSPRSVRTAGPPGPVAAAMLDGDGRATADDVRQASSCRPGSTRGAWGASLAGSPMIGSSHRRASSARHAPKVTGGG